MIGVLGVSAQELSDTIGAIYDCAINPDGWQQALQRLGDLCESPAGGLCIHDVRGMRDERYCDFGHNPDFYQTHQNYVALSPFVTAASVSRVGDFATLGMLCSDQELFESRFYRELLQPFGYRDMVSVLALRWGNRIAATHFCRIAGTARYGDRDTELFKVLAPHICRALSISDALDLSTLEFERLEATLNGLTAGVFLIGRDQRILFMNAAAERQVESGQAIRIKNDRMNPTDAAARAALAKTIDKIAREDIADLPAGHSLAIPEPGGAGYVGTLLPLQHGKRNSVFSPFAASAAFFVQHPAEVPPFPGEAFARLYGLTAGELRVLLAIAQGLSAKDAGDVLGISEPTVRTHLQHIFSKTGTSRQADLLALIHRAAPRVKAR